MIKTRKNPLIYLLLLSALLIIGSNFCCTGKTTSAEPIISNNNYVLLDKTNTNTDVITLTESNFSEKIKSGITLVDFWASWCMPCKKQAPIIETVSNEIHGKALIGKLDVDQHPSISAMYGVQGIPTMILFKNGKEIKRFVGLTSKEDIINAINNVIK
jgi:thioredoxin 1